MSVYEVNLDSFSNGITEIINEKHAPLKYYGTKPVILETFLDKDVEHWQQVSSDYMKKGHENTLIMNFILNLGHY